MQDRKIREAIQALAGTRFAEEVFVLPATVTAVNQLARTCDVIPISGKGDTPITGVRLMAEVDDGLLIVPAVNSTVFIGYTRNISAFVIQFSAIQYVIWYVGSSAIEINSNGVININGGKNGGMINIASLVTKLNNLENIVNDISSKFNSHTHVLTLSTGTGTAAPTTTTENQTLTTTQRSDLEDKNVNH